MLTTILLLLGLKLACSAQTDGSNRTTLPDLLGPYPVSVRAHEVFTNRWDPLAPTTEKRRFMVTIFQPLTELENNSCPVPLTYLPYMPPVTSRVWGNYLHKLVPSLPADVTSRIQIANCDAATNETTSTNSPLLVFSPGSGAARMLYDSYNQAFASSGYTVISIDHTYDSLVVEFPDGSLAYRNTIWDYINDSTPAGLDATITPFIPPRSADLSSVLDAIQDASIPGLEAYSETAVTAIAYGQSLGGNTVAAVVEQDPRFKAMMDWGGDLWDPQVRNTTITVPTAFQASQARWDSGHLSETWNSNLWKLLKGWSVAFGINGTQHISVTDIPLFVDVLGLRNGQFNQSFGTITGKRLLNVCWSHGLSFFDFVTNRTTPTLLKGPSPSYPDVFFIREAETGGP